MLIELSNNVSVLVEQGTYHTSVLHVRQFPPSKTALRLIFVACPDSDHLNEPGYCNLFLQGKSIVWSSSGRHRVKSCIVSLDDVLLEGFLPRF